MKTLGLAVALLAMSAGLSACQTDNTPRLKLTKAEAVDLISNSTYYTSTGNSGFYSADGKISASNTRSSSDGTWSVTDAGDVCVSWNNPSWSGGCGPIYRVGTTDKYERTIPSGTSQNTYEKKK